jgi:Winged helix DNA-binding domain
MSPREFLSRRLAGVMLTGKPAERASDVVRTLGAVQAQDFAGAKWALAQRTRGLTDAEVEREFASGAFLRTHVLRPTWHFVRPEDIRWMLALTAPRVKAAMNFQRRWLELDDSVFRRSHAAIEKALAGGKHLTRAELASAIAASLARVGIKSVSGQRLGHLVMRAELDAIVCSGARRGKQQTYALLDERVPPAAPIDRDEALLRLTRLYFATRGPATVHDFAWWSGLTVGDARRGVQIAGRELERITVDDTEYWLTERSVPRGRSNAMLLPNYDEYFIGYKDRSAVAARLGNASAVIGGSALITHVLFMDGQLVGTWKRIPEKARVDIQIVLGCKLSAPERARLDAAMDRFAAFLESPVKVDYRGRFA